LNVNSSGDGDGVGVVDDDAFIAAGTGVVAGTGTVCRAVD